MYLELTLEQKIIRTSMFMKNVWIGCENRAVQNSLGVQTFARIRIRPVTSSGENTRKLSELMHVLELVKTQFNLAVMKTQGN